MCYKYIKINDHFTCKFTYFNFKQNLAENELQKMKDINHLLQDGICDTRSFRHCTCMWKLRVAWYHNNLFNAVKN